MLIAQEERPPADEAPQSPASVGVDPPAHPADQQGVEERRKEAMGKETTKIDTTPEAAVEAQEKQDPTITDASLEAEFAANVMPLLEANCFDCHSGSEPEAGVDLSMYKTLEQIRGAPSLWKQVRGLVQLGAMPPPDDYDPLPEETKEAVASWVDLALNYADCSECYHPAPVTVRRLNAVEYDHAIRDIFGVDLQPSRKIGFVTDEVGNGFDNQGEVLTLSPLAIEKYLQASSYVAEQVIVTDPETLRRQQFQGGAIERGENFETTFDVAAGEYEIETRLEFGFQRDFSVDAEVYLDGERIEAMEVPPRRKEFKWKRTLSDGQHTLRIHFVQNEKIGEQGGTRYRLRIDGVQVNGPTEGLPKYPLAHRNAIIAEPGEGVSVAQAAEKIAQNLLRKAYRRPPSPEAVQAFVDEVTRSVEGGSNFAEGVKRGIELAFVMPDFLFRLETESGIPANQPHLEEDVQQVEAYDLASRLSFFLWASIPDQELLDLAADGSLLRTDVIERQVDRMLDDPRAEAGIIRQFFGQWLSLRSLATLEMDQEQFPLYNVRMSEAMIRETELFCADVLRGGKLLDLLSADYSYINPRLAELYGVEYEGQDPEELYLGRRGRGNSELRSGTFRDEEKFVKVKLDGQRRGILTHASILTLTSQPTRTSPVKRGKWVLENIMGDPPPPAPPGVPPLEQAGEGTENLSLRQQLELHRANPSCASCHKVMDPIGLGLENFNAVGQYREKDGELPVDSAGQLADGREFNGSAELLALLLSDEEKFARHFTTKLLTFALGRGLVRYDRCAIESILAQSKPSGYELRTIVKAIATSDLMRYR